MVSFGSFVDGKSLLGRTAGPSFTVDVVIAGEKVVPRAVFEPGLQATKLGVYLQTFKGVSNGDPQVVGGHSIGDPKQKGGKLHSSLFTGQIAKMLEEGQDILLTAVLIF